MILRRATITWLDHPPTGRGRVRVDSRAFTALPLSMPANGPPHPTEATPGELLAAANGAFFLGALAESLLRAGTPARELVVEADCEIGAGRVDHRLTAVEISVHGIVDGVDEAAFEASAHDALDRARGWLALEHGLPMNVRAHLRRRGPSH